MSGTGKTLETLGTALGKTFHVDLRVTVEALTPGQAQGFAMHAVQLGKAQGTVKEAQVFGHISRVQALQTVALDSGHTSGPLEQKS